MTQLALPNRDFVYSARNWRRYAELLKQQFGVAVASRCGIVTMSPKLTAVLCRRRGYSPWNGGELFDLGLLSCRVVTDAGVQYLVDDWDLDTLNISDFNFHDSGTGVAAPAVGDTGLQTQAGPTTRATGTKSQPSANVLRTVGTIAYSSTLAITEHGLFDQAAQGGTLWDRHTFTAINVVNGDSIQFTYDLTVNSGG